MFILRFDLRVPDMGSDQIADQYAAAIEMSEWADARGCVTVAISEHHASPDGYLPTPLMLASAIAARTSRVRIGIAAALLPMYDPVRLAEEMIVLDHLSRGRATFTLGIGYRPDEYELFGIPFEDRGRLADDKLDRLLGLLRQSDAATDRVRITPAPYTKGGPKISWGGSSKAAARRAGRNGLDMIGSGTAPGLEEAYAEAARAAGREPGTCMIPQPRTPTTVFVSDDQDTAWAELGPYLMNDVRSYGEWNEGLTNVASISYSRTIEDLREERGAHRIFTVDEAAQYAQERFVLPLHPLCGGVPPAVAWPYLRRVVDEVMPRIAH